MAAAESTVEKGDRLEHAFYSYLCDQQARGDLLFGTYSSQVCKVYEKKKYPCPERGRDVEFDVVIEVTSEGRSTPHLYVVFECKNHEHAVQERDVTDFSDKLRRIFGQAAKGVLLYSNRVQSGAKSICLSRNIGLAKYDEHGLSIKADRGGRDWSENGFVERQLFDADGEAKPLRFSAFYDGKLLSSVNHLLRLCDPTLDDNDEVPAGTYGNHIPYISHDDIQSRANSLLESVGYEDGPVDLCMICTALSLSATFSEKTVFEATGEAILGTANFDNKEIEINYHDNEQRKRFTFGHEIGHFHLGHDKYLRSESVIEQDLIEYEGPREAFNYDRLEFQANIFASELLLPQRHFEERVKALRVLRGIEDRGHGFIFVDDQPCNYAPYNALLAELSVHFDVSRKAIEVKLNRMGWLRDVRHKAERVGANL